jgi:hypothetical protein
MYSSTVKLELHLQRASVASFSGIFSYEFFKRKKEKFGRQLNQKK